MRIDLDELERKARAVSGDLWRRRTAEAAAAAHIAANRPLVTLALIARIRELEDALRGAVSLAEVHDPTGWHPDWLALLEKGAVLV